MGNRITMSIESMGNRIDELEQQLTAAEAAKTKAAEAAKTKAKAATVEVAQAWAAGSSLAQSLTAADAATAAARAATATARAATATAQAATATAEAALAKTQEDLTRAQAEAKHWKDMYDELLTVMPPLKRR